MSGDVSIGRIENGVLVGKGGMLFLAGGTHSPLESAIGRRGLSETSIENCVANVLRRSLACSQRGIGYGHLIIPDKQTIVPHLWPFDVLISPAKAVVDRLALKRLPIVYPLWDLAHNWERSLSKVDTHLTDFGSIVLAKSVSAFLTGQDEIAKAEFLQAALVPGSPQSGDLGSKLSPNISFAERILGLPPPGRSFHNQVPGGNNGIVDIRLNQTAVYDSRLLVFGDSFGRHLCRMLQHWFREVVFLRTPFFHDDVVDAIAPDFVVTQTIERYLDNILDDAERPSFFMYPYMTQSNSAVSREFAKAFSALLSVGRPPYERFMNAETEVLLEPLERQTMSPTAFSFPGLVQQFGIRSQIRCLEAERTAKRKPPAVVLDLSDDKDAVWLSSQQTYHSSSLVNYKNVFLFGPNVVVNQEGEWACESYLHPWQYVNLVGAPGFLKSFPGPKPMVKATGGLTELDSTGLLRSDIIDIHEAVFLATPLEPNNYGRWIKTVLPKIHHFRKVSSERKFLCYAGREWQASILRRFGLSESSLLAHDPGKTYFCGNVDTVQYSVTNMSVSLGDQQIYNEIREESVGGPKVHRLTQRSDRVFLTRMGMAKRFPNYRVLQNESALADRLQSLGFTIIEPEAYSFDDQVAIFASSRVIICTGGAALYNSVFARPDSIVVSLESSHAFLRPHTDLLSSLSIEYGFIIGKQVKDSSSSQAHQHWTIDVDRATQEVMKLMR